MKIGRRVLAAVSIAAAVALSAGAASASTIFKGYNFTSSGPLTTAQSITLNTYVTKATSYVFTFAFRLRNNFNVTLTSTMGAPFTVELFKYPTSCSGHCVGGGLLVNDGLFSAGTSTTAPKFALGYTAGVAAGVPKNLAGKYYYEVATTAPVGTSGVNHFTLQETLNAGAVPEPATWSMMILGFGAVGAVMRRSRRKQIGVFATA